jgi:hypothetical protein
MTTPQDLMITAMDVAPSRPVERGEVSLALAGAEVVDLRDAGVLRLDGERLVPAGVAAVEDPLLGEAAAALVRESPYETVEDWLWRRGQGLSARYLAALEAGGSAARQRGRWIPVRTGRTVLVDSPARRSAAERWERGEPVLTHLAAALGIYRDGAEGPEAGAEGLDDFLTTVLAAVHGAVTELEAVRQRRSVEDAAFDNIWRAP